MTKQEIKIYNKNYRQINREKLLKQKKNYYQLHKRKIAKNHKEWYLKNREQLNKYRRKKYLKNRLIILEYQKIYQKLHRKERRKYQCNYKKNRRNMNVNFRLSDYLRHRIYSALKGNPKLSTTMKLVGCSIRQLKQHLENKFRDNMSWDNYGLWHVDHIKPCVSFDLSKLSEQKKCFHYSNLQPLWAKDNLSKNKYFKKD